MAKQKHNIVMAGTSGNINDQIVFRQLRGKSIIGRYPRFDPKRPPTEKELNAKKAFLEAAKKVQELLLDDAVKKMYARAAHKLGMSASNLAMKDAFEAPKVTSIDAKNYQGVSGDLIVIKAEDNFEVVRVVVTIQDETGSILEEGEAVKNKSDGKYRSSGARRHCNYCFGLRQTNE